MKKPARENRGGLVGWCVAALRCGGRVSLCGCLGCRCGGGLRCRPFGLVGVGVGLQLIGQGLAGFGGNQRLLKLLVGKGHLNLNVGRVFGNDGVLSHLDSP